MNEAKLLELFAEIYGIMSTPKECAVEFIGIKKMLIKVGKIDKEAKPPTLEAYNLIYYVKDSGLETEEAFLNIGNSNSKATAEIKVVAESKPAEPDLIELEVKL